MLDIETRRKIDSCRDILVGKIPDPKSQVEQITIALIYKFMDDMDKESIYMGGKAGFFTEEFERYSWSSIFNPRIGGHELLNTYGEALVKMNHNPNIPQLFRDIFKNAFLPYRDPETLKSFLKEINSFTYDHSEKLGDAFEYLLSVLSSQGDAGQFRTPRHIIDFMVKVVDPQLNETVLDPACGTAGFLISAYKHIISNNKNLTATQKKRLIKNFVGYDISPDMVRLSLVNMYLHGFVEPHIHEYDTLTTETRWQETYDVIMANPPFMTPKGGIRPHNRFSIQAKRSEVLFVDYIAEHLNPSGRAAVIVPEGIIFQSQTAYKALRKMLVENCLWAVVSLPAGIFNPYSGVKTSILFMDKSLAKRIDRVLFVKIENDGFDLGAQRRAIEKNDLTAALKYLNIYKRKIENFKSQISEADFAHAVTKKEIAKSGDYNLTGDRYRVFEQHTGQWPTVELDELFISIKNGVNVAQSDEAGKYRVTRIQTIADGTVDLSKTKWTNEDPTEDYFMRYGDILLSHINSIDHLAKSALFPKINEKVVHGINLIRFRPDIAKINPEYAIACFKSELFVQKARTFAQKAVNQASIKTSDLKQIQIPLPPLGVQEKIVAEIEGYQKIIDAARQICENYKPQIKINANWPMVELGGICKNLDGKRIPVTKSKREDGKYPYYGASGIVDYVDDYIFDDDLLLVSEDGANLLARVTPIAFSVSGKCWVNNHAHVLKFSNMDTQYFVEHYLNSISLDNFITGSAQPKLNQAALNTIPIPLPSEKEQRQIVEAIGAEQRIVNENKKLGEIFEGKIKDVISEIWAE